MSSQRIRGGGYSHERSDPRPGDRGVLRITYAYVTDCFKAESAPHVNELAARLQMNRTNVTRAIMRLTGKTAADYLRYLCVVRARVLLGQQMPLNTVAYRSGFTTRATFFRAFKAATGLTPDAYRRKH